MRGAALLATAVTPLFAAVQPGQATAAAGHEAKRCGLLAKGSADYRIKARKLTCRFARRSARAYLNRRSAAAGFDCYRPGTNVAFYCANGAKAYWGERLSGTGDTVLWVWTGPDLDHTVTADPGQAEHTSAAATPTR